MSHKREIWMLQKHEIWMSQKSEIWMLQVTNKVFPWPAISWYKDGALLSSQDPRVTITSKKYDHRITITSKKYLNAPSYDNSCEITEVSGLGLFIEFFA